MTRGDIVPLALMFSLLPFGLLVYVVVAETGGPIIRVVLGAAFVILAFRGVGLKRASGEVAPQEGHVAWTGSSK